MSRPPAAPPTPLLTAAAQSPRLVPWADDVGMAERYAAGNVIGSGTYGTIRECRLHTAYVDTLTANDASGHRRERIRRLNETNALAVKAQRHDVHLWENFVFLREMDALQRTRSFPGTIDVHDCVFDRQQQCTFIVMDRMDGTLSQFIRDAPFPIRYAYLPHIATQLLLTLAYLDQHRIAHRDIKPTNILVTQRWQVSWEEPRDDDRPSVPGDDDPRKDFHLFCRYVRDHLSSPESVFQQAPSEHFCGRPPDIAANAMAAAAAAATDSTSTPMGFGSGVSSTATSPGGTNGHGVFSTFVMSDDESQHHPTCSRSSRGSVRPAATSSSPPFLEADDDGFCLSDDDDDGGDDEASDATMSVDTDHDDDDSSSSTESEADRRRGFCRGLRRTHPQPRTASAFSPAPPRPSLSPPLPPPPPSPLPYYRRPHQPPPQSSLYQSLRASGAHPVISPPSFAGSSSFLSTSAPSGSSSSTMGSAAVPVPVRCPTQHPEVLPFLSWSPACRHLPPLAASSMPPSSLAEPGPAPVGSASTRNVPVVVLCDFGLAKQLTKRGDTPGLVTANFRPPELFGSAHRPSTYRTNIDVWSLGCTLVEYLTGSMLFVGRTDEALMHDIARVTHYVPRRWRARFPSLRPFVSSSASSPRAVAARLRERIVASLPSPDARRLLHDERGNDDALFDLLACMLCPSGRRRPSATALLAHGYVRPHVDAALGFMMRSRACRDGMPGRLAPPSPPMASVPTVASSVPMHLPPDGAGFADAVAAPDARSDAQRIPDGQGRGSAIWAFRTEADFSDEQLDPLLGMQYCAHVTLVHRELMCEWMWYQNASLGFRAATAVATICNLDRFLSRAARETLATLRQELFVLCGIVCMYLTIQYYEQQPVTLRVLTDTCGYAFSESDEQRCIHLVLSALHYQISAPAYTYFHLDAPYAAVFGDDVPSCPSSGTAETAVCNPTRLMRLVYLCLRRLPLALLPRSVLVGRCEQLCALSNELTSTTTMARRLLPVTEVPQCYRLERHGACRARSGAHMTTTLPPVLYAPEPSWAAVAAPPPNAPLQNWGGSFFGDGRL